MHFKLLFLKWLSAFKYGEISCEMSKFPPVCAKLRELAAPDPYSCRNLPELLVIVSFWGDMYAVFTAVPAYPVFSQALRPSISCCPSSFPPSLIPSLLFANCIVPIGMSLRPLFYSLLLATDISLEMRRDGLQLRGNASRWNFWREGGGSKCYLTFGTWITGRMVLILKGKIVKRNWFGIGHGVGVEVLLELGHGRGLFESSEEWEIWHWNLGDKIRAMGLFWSLDLCERTQRLCWGVGSAGERFLLEMGKVG